MRIFIFLLYVNLATAQQNVTSTIDEVTVYLQGARITRSASVKVNKGANEIIIDNLSPDIDDSSIILTDLAGMSLSGINYATSVLEQKAPTALLENLNKRLDSVLLAKVTVEAEMAGLNEEKTLLQNNRNLNKTDSGLTLSQIKEFGSYYNSRITDITVELSRLSKVKIELLSLEDQLNISKLNINPQMNELRGTITLNVTSNISKTVNLKIVYNVNNAGWVPLYDITAAGIDREIDLKFKAQVYQTSGTDWENVKMILSTGDPFVDNTKPVLEAKRLNFVHRGYSSTATRRSNKKYNPTIKQVRGLITDPNGTPIFGATVQEAGTNNFTTTDFDGRYILNIKNSNEVVISYTGYDQIIVPIYSSIINEQLKSSLDEVVVVGYLSSSRTRKRASDDMSDLERPEIITAIEENVASRTYELAQPYSIPSTGATTDIEISSNNIIADFEYYTAPVINENVFLTAKLKNWESLNLIPGEANIYFENAYTGKIYLDTDTTEDELTISLGVDPQISVAREDIQDFKAKSFFGDKRIVNKKYEIIVKNNRNKTIALKVQDRIPLSSNSDIKIDDQEPGDAEMDKETQILTWNIDLASGAQVKKSFSYEVRYPKNKRINLN